MPFDVHSTSCHLSAHDLAFPIDEKGCRTVPDSVPIGARGVAVHEDRKGNVKLIPMIPQILLPFFGRHLEEDQIGVS